MQLMGKLVYLVVVLIAFVTPSLAQIEWEDHTVDGNVDGIVRLEIADLDGDGHLDLLAAATNDGVAWWRNQGEMVWFRIAIDDELAGAHGVAADDIDNDGDTDVVAVSAVSHSVSWYENQNYGTSWVEHTVAGSFSFPKSVETADLDGDGDVDIVAAADGDNEIAWWENQDSGTTWNHHTLVAAFNGAQSVHVTDIENDGDLDVLGTALSGPIHLWLNSGGATGWTETTVTVDAGSPQTVYAADVDGDGFKDVVSAGFNSDTVYWWKNDGLGGGWLEHIVATGFDGASGVHAADVDSDGDVDILGAAWLNGGVAWWENLYGGTSWSEHTLIEYGSFDVAARDVDSDGDMDVVGAVAAQSDLMLFEQISDPPILQLELTVDAPVYTVPGGEFDYSAILTSNLPSLNYVDIWTEAVLPNGNTYGPIWQIDDLPMGPNTVIFASAIMQAIPNTAPLGEYHYRMNAGIYPNNAIAQDQFVFTVIGASPTARSDHTYWEAWGYENAFAADAPPRADQPSHPTRMQLSDVYPTPFNSSARFSITLPEATHLSVTLVNIQGREVMRVAEGYHHAGRNEFMVNGQDLASGVYFVRATAGSGELLMKKTVLLK